MTVAFIKAYNVNTDERFEFNLPSAGTSKDVEVPAGDNIITLYYFRLLVLRQKINIVAPEEEPGTLSIGQDEVLPISVHLRGHPIREIGCDATGQ